MNWETLNKQSLVSQNIVSVSQMSTQTFVLPLNWPPVDRKRNLIYIRIVNIKLILISRDQIYIFILIYWISSVSAKWMSKNISFQTPEKMKKAPRAVSRTDHVSSSKRVSLQNFDGKIKLFNLGHNPEDSMLKLEGHQRADVLMFLTLGYLACQENLISWHVPSWRVCC